MLKHFITFKNFDTFKINKHLNSNNCQNKKKIFFDEQQKLIFNRIRIKITHKNNTFLIFCKKKAKLIFKKILRKTFETNN